MCVEGDLGGGGGQMLLPRGQEPLFIGFEAPRLSWREARPLAVN